MRYGSKELIRRRLRTKIKQRRIHKRKDPAVPVTKSSEVVKMPAPANAEVVVQKKFYEDAATEAEQEKHLSFITTHIPRTKELTLLRRMEKNSMLQLL